MLRARIVSQLKSGLLEHGDRLASVRELGEQLDIDPRVVLAAYEQLVEEGLVEIRARSGVFVTGTHVYKGTTPALPRRWVIDTLLGAIERDIPPVVFVEHLKSAMATRRVRVAVIECNLDQLHSMREELRTFFGLEVVTVPLETLESGTVPDELAAVDLLISAGHVEVVARTALALEKPFVITRVRPALLRRLTRLLTQGPVYFLVTDPRFGTKMRRLIAPMSRSENFHVLNVDRDDVRVIPAGAPTYVMRRARTRLAATGHMGREILPQRIFSLETSREILSKVLELSGEFGNERRDVTQS